jgi:hypothetical protein
MYGSGSKGMGTSLNLSQVTNFDQNCNSEIGTFFIDEEVKSSGVKKIQKKASLVSDKNHDLFSCLEKDRNLQRRAFQPYSLPETSRMGQLYERVTRKTFLANTAADEYTR